MREKESGFTLLELLIVMVIIGILATILFFNFTAQFQKTRLRNAVTMLSSDLERARSASWRSGQNTKIQLLGNGSGYTYQQGVSTSTVVFPDGVTASLAPASLANSISYTAPFADTGAISGTFTLRGVNPSYTDAIRIIGVTGKVIR
ncbi:prepilin-type N-terminal cleavage/methylation domain-containing protein [Deinococcus psychrotolerans]|uniref:Prepilin-type N-terminal cleavage/methylation domain-containing protein n=1 Tax=Deinococcus psychrotolerans TaxID=2489213 RepID=A0A3G8YAC3_9DEIO|nr:prepilin-type N-terminal cleavage/methylation domain-containing protein [Deinococcus psychrotolerans]AZI42338.1 prepilin-type N-terminal cleavage/methylation domain-containing protein [Deinococcus psychrotolerans]